METIKTLLWVIQILSALAIIILVLLQHGKGADAGATFGNSNSGANSLFGATGSTNFLSRLTAICATVFFIITFILAMFAHGNFGNSAGIMSSLNGKKITTTSASK